MCFSNIDALCWIERGIYKRLVLLCLIKILIQNEKLILEKSLVFLFIGAYFKIRATSR